MHLTDDTLPTGDVLRERLAHMEEINSGLEQHIGLLKEQMAKDQREQQRLQLLKLESLLLLAGGVAHHFNNLLTGVLGNISLMKAEFRSQPRVNHYLHQEEQAATRAVDLCKQILAYSGKASFILEPTTWYSLLAEMKNSLVSALPSAIDFQWQIAQDLPKISADRNQLRQLVQNLIANSIEAMGEQGGTLTLSTGEAELQDNSLPRTQMSPDFVAGRFVYLEIRDTGTGITPELSERIFDPFFTTKLSGRGLGLAVALGIVRSHRGAIGVHSVLGEGTAFRVYLPAALRIKPTTKMRLDQAKAAPERVTILVVDDEAIIRNLTARMLESLGFRVLTAEDGLQALSYLQRVSQPVQLVLLDMNMPHLDGERTLELLRKMDNQVPVILMSGYNTDDLSDRMADKNVAGFLQKPFKLEELEELVKMGLRTVPSLNP